jgi:chloride channel 3/4/5
MCGVTRLSVTLAVILFELTGSLDHVLPFSLAILCAKWTADAIEPKSIYVSSVCFLRVKTVTDDQ